MTQERMISRATCGMAAIVCGLCVALLSANEPGMNSEAERHFENANELHKLADYEGALAEYRAVMSVAPGTAIAQNAHYWVGQIQYEQHDFDAALATYGEIIAKYPTSTVVPTTRVMLERAKQAKKNKSLFEAVQKADIEQVKSLIAAGAEVDARWGDTHTTEKENDATPLSYAVDANSMDLVRLLVEAGADVNAGGWPPLCRAVDKNNTAIAEYLIDHGANVNVEAPQGWTPLCETINIINSSKMADLLITRGADINAGYWPPLWNSVFKKRNDLFDLLIQRGANVNTPDKSGHTPLYCAVQNDELSYLEILIAKGAKVDAKQPGGETALMSGALVGRAQAVKLLLEAGAEVNAKDDDSAFTALHYAARFGNKSVADVLIAKGADINAKDKEGHTPLYVAVNHDYRVAELLIKKSADSSIRTGSGNTLLELAQQRRQIEAKGPDVMLDGDPNSFFGHKIVCGDVDGDGNDDILIAAPYYRGRVYLFYGGPDMDTTADLIFEGQNEGDWFGDGIACGDIDNDGHADIIIGASGYSEDQGRAYLYWGSDRNAMDANPDEVFTGENKKGCRFGFSPAVCDIDNDGYDDIIVGAYWYPGDGTGRAYLYYGNKKELMDTSYDLVFTAETSGGRFGGTISCGDVDNDGYGDVVIRSYVGQGKAYLYCGSSRANMDAKADGIFGAQSTLYKWGNGLACVDQDGDGYDDVLIGAPAYNDRQGRAYLFRGSSKRGMDADPDMILDGEVEGGLYGVRVVCGDIDGDKVSDLIIGANGYRQGVGRVYVYWGKELSAPDPKPGKIFTGEDPQDEFGLGLACGDVNNDGFDDLVIGAYGYKSGAKQGRVYLYYGGPRKK